MPPVIPALLLVMFELLITSGVATLSEVVAGKPISWSVSAWADNCANPPTRVTARKKGLIMLFNLDAHELQKRLVE